MMFPTERDPTLRIFHVVVYFAVHKHYHDYTRQNTTVVCLCLLSGEFTEIISSLPRESSAYKQPLLSEVVPHLSSPPVSCWIRHLPFPVTLSKGSFQILPAGSARPGARIREGRPHPSTYIIGPATVFYLLMSIILKTLHLCIFFGGHSPKCPNVEPPL